MRAGLPKKSDKGGGRLEPRGLANVPGRAHQDAQPELCGRRPHRAVPRPQERVDGASGARHGRGCHLRGAAQNGGGAQQELPLGWSSTQELLECPGSPCTFYPFVRTHASWGRLENAARCPDISSAPLSCWLGFSFQWKTCTFTLELKEQHKMLLQGADVAIRSHQQS